MVVPSGVETTGWPPVRDRLAEWGIRFDEWQDGLGRLMLAKRGDGKYAATVGGVVLSIPRQVAKTFIVSRVVFALATLNPGMKILWTAQHGRTIDNTFRGLGSFAKTPGTVAPYLARNGVRETNGQQEIKFRNGSVILFGAREFGFGRGFDQVDIIVFDECQHLSERALEDMAPSTNQATFPAGGLLIFMGTPPRPVDNGEVFAFKRQKAIAGGDDLVYVEFSADPNCDPDDRREWAKANPSFPSRTPLESMLRMRENLPSDESWFREALGVWDEVAVGGVIPMDAWEDRADASSVAVDRLALGIEVAPDQASASVALAGVRADEAWHVELEDARKGADWLIAHVTALLEANPGAIRAVVGDVGGPLKALLDVKGNRYFLAGTRVEVMPLKVSELGAACSRLLEGVRAGWVRHIGQTQLTAAAAVAGKRDLGDSGLWTWSRKAATSDITPVQAATYALHGAQAKTTVKPRKRASSRGGGPSGRRAVVL